jgi:hypothetical protein
MASPSILADTSTVPARPSDGTTDLAPSSTHPSPSRTARVVTSAMS